MNAEIQELAAGLHLRVIPARSWCSGGKGYVVLEGTTTWAMLAECPTSAATLWYLRGRRDALRWQE